MAKRGGKADGRPFEPGKSGNPKGRPRSGESLAEAVRAKWPPARLVEHIEKLATSAQSDTTRLAALQMIEQRGYGRVPQGVEMDFNAVGPEAQAMLGALRMTPHERRAALESQDDTLPMDAEGVDVES